MTLDIFYGKGQHRSPLHWNRGKPLQWHLKGTSCRKWAVGLNMKNIGPSHSGQYRYISRVVNMGTSSKKSKRNFVPMVHPGTVEVVPMVKKQSKQR